MATNKILSTTATACALLALSATAQARHIDFFDAGAFSFQAVSGTSNSSTQIVPSGDTGAVGGRRDVTLFNTIGPLGQAVSASLSPDSPDIVNDALTFAADPLAQGSLLLEYGVGGPLGLNLLDIGDGNLWNRLELDIQFAPSTAITVDLIKGAQEASVTQQFLGGPGQVQFDYADFQADNPFFTDAVLRDIDGISLVVEGGVGQSYDLVFFGRGGLTVVPIPAAAWLFLSALGMLGWMRRRAG